MSEVKLPELGEGIDDATLACWHFKVGDSVGLDDDIVELVTDKASFNVPANMEGTIKKICVNEGQKVKIGETLAVIEA